MAWWVNTTAPAVIILTNTFLVLVSGIFWDPHITIAPADNLCQVIIKYFAVKMLDMFCLSVTSNTISLIRQRTFPRQYYNAIPGYETLVCDAEMISLRSHAGYVCHDVLKYFNRKEKWLFLRFIFLYVRVWKSSFVEAFFSRNFITAMIILYILFTKHLYNLWTFYHLIIYNYCSHIKRSIQPDIQHLLGFNQMWLLHYWPSLSVCVITIFINHFDGWWSRFLPCGRWELQCTWP